MNSKLNPEIVTPDNPEATNEWFAKAKPAADVLPELFGSLAASEMLISKKRGRPNAGKIKPPANAGGNSEIADALKNCGTGGKKINELFKY